MLTQAILDAAKMALIRYLGTRDPESAKAVLRLTGALLRQTRR